MWMTTAPDSPHDAASRRRRRRKTPLQLRLLRMAFSTLGHIAPGIMANYAYLLWFRTRRSPESRREQQFLRSAEASTLQHQGYELAVNSWGKGAVILLVHGWNGRGAQLGAFVSPLVEKGFRVVAFDTPAHGRSTGNSTNIFEIAAAITHVASHVGGLYGVIAHSFGVPSTLLAIQQGLQLTRMAAISPPANYEMLVRPFTRALHIPDKVDVLFRQKIERQFGRGIWKNLATENIVREMLLPALIIHDQDDHDVPWRSGKAVADAWPNARFVTTHRLGHRRILRSPQVIDMVTHFMHTTTPTPD